MGDGRAGAHRRSDERGFGKLRFGGAGLKRLLLVDFDAIGALRGERHRHRHQLLVLLRDRAVGARRLVEGEEALPSVWRLGAERLQLLHIRHVEHTHRLPPALCVSCKDTMEYAIWSSFMLRPPRLSTVRR